MLAASLVLLPFALPTPRGDAELESARLGRRARHRWGRRWRSSSSTDAQRYGASRSSLVTYLLPPFALFYGVVFLDERMTLNAILGLLLILAGVALGSGFMQLARRRVTAPATPRP